MPKHTASEQRKNVKTAGLRAKSSAVRLKRQKKKEKEEKERQEKIEIAGRARAVTVPKGRG